MRLVTKANTFSIVIFCHLYDFFSLQHFIRAKREFLIKWTLSRCYRWDTGDARLSQKKNWQLLRYKLFLLRALYHVLTASLAIPGRSEGKEAYRLNLTFGQVVKDGEASANQRESAERSRQRKRSRKREQVSGNQNFLWLNAAPRCVQWNRKGRLWPPWPPSRKQRRQNTDLHSRSVLVYVL